MNEGGAETLIEVGFYCKYTVCLLNVFVSDTFSRVSFCLHNN